MEAAPGGAELIEAAIESLRADVLPALAGRAAFQARMVIAVLEIARRESVDASQADAREAACWSGLPTIAAADPQGMRHAVCEAIREGAIDADTPGLRARLWTDVLARVAIDQPNYPSYVRESPASDDFRRP